MSLEEKILAQIYVHGPHFTPALWEGTFGGFRDFHSQQQENQVK